MAVRARGREVYLASDGTTADPFTTIPLGVTLVGTAVGLVASYYFESAAIARGIRKSGLLDNPKALPSAGRPPALHARVEKVPHAGGFRIGVIGGSGNTERSFPDTEQGRAKAERTAAYLNSLDEVPAGGDRAKRQGKPAHSAGTPTPRGERGAREWRKGGRITGMQG